MRYSIIIAISIFLYISKTCRGSQSDVLRQRKLPPCRACRVFIDSFERGMKKTAKGKFEGGDAAWEEAKLGNYATSEIRLTEIQETVCSDVEEGRDQCYSFHEQYDGEIEEWWFNRQSIDSDLFKYFCIDTVQLCCPHLHYGMNCTACPGYPDNVCNNNGKCKGAGTRKGNGRCACDHGYTGEHCNACAENYYQSYKDDKKVLCSKCHVSCLGACKSAGPMGCEMCADGWTMDEERGCLDINECAILPAVCPHSQFCVNSDGGYKCLECDSACDGCTGDGPDMCVKCAAGYVLQDNMCTSVEQQQRNYHVFVTRYLTYLGLCIATCIIFQKSIILAAVVGVTVAIYISVSEYVLGTATQPDTASLMRQMVKHSN